jgi:hypothetical protein
MLIIPIILLCLFSNRRKHMDKVLRRRKSIDDENVELPSCAAADDSWRCEYDSDDARESSSAPANRRGNDKGQGRVSMAAENMSLKSRVAALAKITQYV